MLPGFATDVLGLFFLLPFTRPFARKLLAFFVARRLSRSGIVPGSTARVRHRCTVGRSSPARSSPTAPRSPSPLTRSSPVEPQV